MRVEFNIVPIPASRPRVTRWATYYGKKYSKFKEDMETLTNDIKFTPLEGNIYASLRFYIQIPKSWPKKKKKVKNDDVQNKTKNKKRKRKDSSSNQHHKRKKRRRSYSSSDSDSEDSEEENDSEEDFSC